MNKNKKKDPLKPILKNNFIVKNNSKLDKLIGPFTLAFTSLPNNNECRIDYSNTLQIKHLILHDNLPQPEKKLNPYELMVNGDLENNKSFSFKAKAFYDQALSLSKMPKYAKLDETNPIYLYVFNQKDHQYYTEDIY